MCQIHIHILHYESDVFFLGTLALWTTAKVDVFP